MDVSGIRQPTHEISMLWCNSGGIPLAYLNERTAPPGSAPLASLSNPPLTIRRWGSLPCRRGIPLEILLEITQIPELPYTFGFRRGLPGELDG